MTRGNSDNDLEQGGLAVRLRQQLAALREAPVPQATRDGWRQALDTAPTRRGRRRLAPLLRWSLATVGLATASLVALLVISLISPSVALWAGSLPGVGRAFTFFGIDEGVRAAAYLGLVQEIDAQAVRDGITLRVRGITADAVRTVIEVEWVYPESATDLDFGWARYGLTDQWGHQHIALVGREILPSYVPDPPDLEHGMTFIRYVCEFKPLDFLTRRLTLDAKVLRKDQAPYEFGSVSFGVDLRPSASHSLTLRPNTVFQMGPYTVTLEQVVLGHTATQVTIRIEGWRTVEELHPSFRHRGTGGSFHGFSGQRDDVWTYVFTTSPMPQEPGTYSIPFDLSAVEPSDAQFALRPDGTAPGKHRLGSMDFTIAGWRKVDGEVEVDLHAEPVGGGPDATGVRLLLEMVPGGDRYRVDASKPQWMQTVRFSYDRPGDNDYGLKALRFALPPGVTTPEAIHVVAIEYDLPRLMLEFAVPK